jgi:hypothetical protein
MKPCIEHTQNQSRYGYTSRGGKSCLLHRVVYAEANGLDVHTMGGTVLHSCDNSKCIEPSHLTLGTQSENVLDCVSKGRHRPRRGVDSPAAKLTEADVEAIRASTDLQRVVAARYGIRQSQVSRIKGGTRW